MLDSFGNDAHLPFVQRDDFVPKLQLHASGYDEEDFVRLGMAMKIECAIFDSDQSESVVVGAGDRLVSIELRNRFAQLFSG